MSEPKVYLLPPTKLIPNSPYPLLHYPDFFGQKGDLFDAATIYDRFSSNGWSTQWIFRYGQSQTSHYHSQAHECMVVLSGEATIRFGVGDTDDDLEKSTYGDGKEIGGIELHAKVGDVFIVPAGVAHKTFDATEPGFRLLTPGDGHGIEAPDARKALADIKLSGFTMIGSYPKDSVWDFAEGGHDEGQYEKVWSTAKPPSDPVMGDNAGLCVLWK